MIVVTSGAVLSRGARHTAVVHIANRSLPCCAVQNSGPEYRVADCRRSSALTGGWFSLSVPNSGEPIPPAALKNISQPFTLGSLGSRQQYLGLRLYIVHQIAVAHGGRLDVVSVRTGTRFTFRMPLDP
jgi:signal transduction histidine kinase